MFYQFYIAPSVQLLWCDIEPYCTHMQVAAYEYDSYEDVLLLTSQFLEDKALGISSYTRPRCINFFFLLHFIDVFRFVL